MTQYDAFAQTFSNSRKNLHWPELDAILSDIEKNRYSSILDVWCGNGRLITELKKNNIHTLSYLGVDASEWMIDEAKKLEPSEQFLVSSMPLLMEVPNDRKFDAIVLLASFHHLETEEERRTCLETLKKFLSPNGSVYMTNWNLFDQEKYQKNHRGNGDFDIKIGEFSRYYHGFSLEELTNLFETTGWNILENRIFEGERNMYSKIWNN